MINTSIIIGLLVCITVDGPVKDASSLCRDSSLFQKTESSENVANTRADFYISVELGPCEY